MYGGKKPKKIPEVKEQYNCADLSLGHNYHWVDSQSNAAMFYFSIIIVSWEEDISVLFFVSLSLKTSI